MKKGSLVGVIPMLILLITSSLFAVQSISIANAMADEVIESVENLGKVVDGGSSSGRYFYDHLTKGATYSINQKSYDLGQEGGGVEWSSEGLSLMTTTQFILHNRANTYFSENYIQQDLPSQNCQIGNDQEFNILLPNPQDQVENNRQHISGTVVSSLSEIKTNCQFENSRLQQHATQGFYRARYNASYNRYFQLVKETQAFYKDLKPEWESTQIEYTASATQCGEYPSEEEIEQDAVDKAEAEFENRMRDVADNYPTIDGAEIEVEVTEVDYEVTDTGQSIGSGCDCEPCSSGDDGSDDGGDSNFDQYNDELGGDPADSGGEEDEDVGTGDTSTSTGFFFSSESNLIDKTLDLFKNGYRMSRTGLGNNIQAAYLMRVQSEIEDGGGSTGESSDTGDTDYGREDGDQVDGDPDSGGGDDGSSCTRVCDKNERTTSVTIEVNEVHAESTITDTKYKILLDSGWENLEFHVDDYTQEVEQNNPFSSGLDGFLFDFGFVDQSNSIFNTLIKTGSMTEETRDWIDRGPVWERTSFDVEIDQEDETSTKFQIKLGEKRSIPESTDTIYFFDQQKGFFNNLYFRAKSGTSGSLESCDGSVISGRPLSSFSATLSKCSYSGVGSFESGDRTIGICDYEESSETAYLVALESDATATEISNGCSGDNFVSSTSSSTTSSTDSSGGSSFEEGAPGNQPVAVSRDEILDEPYDPLKIDNNAEAPVDLPSCEADDARIVEPDDANDLKSIFEDQDYRVFCMTPGDYRNGGFGMHSVSGTEDNPRWIRYYNPDMPDDRHPWNMADPETKAADNRVIMDGITWRESNHWVIDRIRFDSRVQTWGSNNFIFNRLMMYRADATVQMKIADSDNMHIQNSVLGKTQRQQCGSSADSNGISIRNKDKEISNNPYIVDNEIFDFWCGDGIQYTGTEKKVFGGVIQGNHIYRSEGWDGSVENAIDLKMGPADNDASLDDVPKEDWIIVENNKMWGEGMNLIYHHEEASGIITRNNIMWDIQGDQFATFPKGTTTNNDFIFYDNIFYDTGGTFKLRHADDSYVARNIFVDSEDSNGDSWSFAHWEEKDGNQPKNNRITKNVFISSGVGDKAENNDISGNAYYDSEPFEGGDPAIEESSADAANHGDLTIEVRPITGPETKTLPGVKVTSDSPHADWFGPYDTGEPRVDRYDPDSDSGGDTRADR